MQLKSFLKPLAAAALLSVAGASQAAITIYTSLAAFNAATAEQGTDTFAGLSISGATPSPITRNAGPYGYTASVSTTSFYGAGTVDDPWLSVNTATDTITFAAFTGGVRAAGGNFFGSDINGMFQAGDVVLTATDASGTVSHTIVSATTASFVGFASDGLLQSITLTGVQPSAGFLWPAADNLVLAVPEPATYGLLAAGLGVVGFAARRRSRR